ncbi:MAG TPA: MupA/Atu3671 family FMN-dependent luciferase-like monooxygenase, partial [Verrucomicrobiae bacterium]|nr:MupA/Atu3671 family FMN-dependent luciferase-like monooxygenase [Verrucomicrobiae bacterium]
RAGSVVLPLHDPIRVAEEWSVVDNLSHGRVGLSFASGWHSNDFVFAPENYADRKKVMFQQIETVLKLWRGETVACPGPDGKEVKVKILPRPVQPNVPVWITASASPDTFRQAGEMGANVLTNLLGQTIEEVAGKIAIYRQAWREHGHGPGEGHVTLMLHTFVDEDMKTVREKVRGPFTEYLKTSMDLVRKAASAWSFAAFQQPASARSSSSESAQADFSKLSPADMEALLEHAFERYFETSGLFGTPASCMKRVNELRRVGVDEIACLIDFGVDVDSVLASLNFLEELNRKSNDNSAGKRANYSVPAQIQRHHVTHLQCTPSLARMLISDPEGATAFGALQEFLVGGEALPPSLASQLLGIVRGRIHNMYGPTETAIWSTTKLLTGTSGDVTIGRPLANTEIYVRDKYDQPAPVGLPGELLIGGEGVARGYLNRPELTAERFIAHPFCSEPVARLYRTGDLARYRENGEIEFLGRLDHQIKLRGHRIELGEIEAALGGHPAVKESVVVANEDASGNARLVAYIVPANRSSAGTETGSPETKDRLAQWQMIWDGAYNEGNPTPDAAFNIAGWNSSYTGQPVPDAEMREWVERTAERIVALRPANALEIGCGTGLLLFRLAPHCKQYIGCDFSERAIEYLRQQSVQLPQVTLLQKTADDLAGVPAESLDTVILNSVAQYFPNIDYLVRVLEGAVKAVSPGGRIFIGDVRNLKLLEAFHASIQMQQAPSELTRNQFRQRVQGQVAREEELVIAPEFFHALRKYLPRITHVQIQLKPGRFHNEVTRFRYDVTLHVDKAVQPEANIVWLDNAPESLTPGIITEALSQNGSGYAGIRRVTNARLVNENLALAWMSGSEGPETLGELRAAAQAERKVNAVDPENVLTLAREAGCAVDIIWTDDADDTGAFDVIFRRSELPSPTISSRNISSRRKAWTEFANQPAKGRPDTKLVNQLRTHLKQRLPAIMV